ncbi:MAG TPA: phage/plasmid primase, P4 family [Ktedonobacteraceae bacterium]|jgi:putative DNA primase/helicase|nr:phage/plasmid primase, P4 family [Ktedonobacteraceae bacterium]
MIDLLNNQSDSNEQPSAPNNRRPLYLTHHLTDLGNARHFIAQFGTQVRYVPSQGWLIFDGTRWHLDDSEQILALAYTSIQSYYEEAEHLTNDDDLRKRLLTHAERCESLPRLSALLQLARTLPGITVPHTRFDADPGLLTVLNGTLDLRTLTLHPHTPEDYITRLIPIAYDPQARSPLWDAFLARFTDHHLPFQRFLQRAVGYSLSGHTGEGTCFLFTGSGQEAHQLFLSILHTLSGDYSSYLPALRPKYLTPALSAARIATIPPHAFLSSYDPATLATLIDAEPLPIPSSSSVVTYQSQAKLWFSAPDLPLLPPALSYLRARFTLLPISLSLTRREASQLAQQLRDILPAILAWAVLGYRLWSVEGFQTPEAVTTASSFYQDEQDGLSSFFEHCCTTGDDSLTIRAHELYQTYCLWSRTRSLPCLSEYAFGRLVLLRGFRRSRQASGRLYHGLALTATLSQLLNPLEHPRSSV